LGGRQVERERGRVVGYFDESERNRCEDSLRRRRTKQNKQTRNKEREGREKSERTNEQDGPSPGAPATARRSRGEGCTMQQTEGPRHSQDEEENSNKKNDNKESNIQRSILNQNLD
jgi:hypothetical protein